MLGAVGALLEIAWLDSTLTAAGSDFAVTPFFVLAKKYREFLGRR
jgi:hypothetical protein